MISLIKAQQANPNLSPRVNGTQHRAGTTSGVKSSSHMLATATLSNIIGNTLRSKEFAGKSTIKINKPPLPVLQGKTPSHQSQKFFALKSSATCPLEDKENANATPAYSSRVAKRTSRKKTVETSKSQRRQLDEGKGHFGPVLHEKS